MDNMAHTESEVQMTRKPATTITIPCIIIAVLFHANCSKGPESVSFFGLRHGMKCEEFAEIAYKMNSDYKEFQKDLDEKSKFRFPYKALDSQYEIEKQCKNGGEDSDGVVLLAKGNGYLLYYGTKDETERIGWLELGPLVSFPNINSASVMLGAPDIYTGLVDNKLVDVTIPVKTSIEEAASIRMKKLSSKFESALSNMVGQQGEPLVEATISKHSSAKLKIWRLKKKLLTLRTNEPDLVHRFASLTGAKYIVNTILKHSPEIDDVVSALKREGIEL